MVERLELEAGLLTCLVLSTAIGQRIFRLSPFG